MQCPLAIVPPLLQQVVQDMIAVICNGRGVLAVLHVTCGMSAHACMHVLRLVQSVWITL